MLPDEEQPYDLVPDNSEFGNIVFTFQQSSEAGYPQLGLFCNRCQQGQIVIQHSRHSRVVEERSGVVDPQPPTVIDILDELDREVENGRSGIEYVWGS